jgi:hypothetical protein
MVNTLLNNKHSQPHQNIFTNQPKNQNRKTARAGDSRNVRQDKGHFEYAPRQAGQPAPFSKGSGARASNTKSTQIHKTKTGREKHIHSTFHLEPGVHADMKWIAEDQGISFSEAGNAACRFYAKATIENRHAETLRDVVRQIIREELQAFGDRIVKFLLRIAFASEQGKLLITNVLKFVLKLSRVDEKTYVTLVDESGKMAKRNILAMTPQVKDLFTGLEAKPVDGAGERKGVKRP